VADPRALANPEAYGDLLHVNIRFIVRPEQVLEQKEFNEVSRCRLNP
jgi:hypothetical protein